MGTKLYVGGLPYSVTEGRLQEIFSAHGSVESANVISDKFTGRSRGFGFVEMSTAEEAQKARQAARAAEGWGGDWAVAWRDGDRSCVTMAIVGDTAVTAWQRSPSVSAATASKNAESKPPENATTTAG